VIDIQTVQNLIASWWFDYDQGNFEVWPKYFTVDAHFSCRTDSGAAPYEELLKTDLHGRDRLVAWQLAHRRGGPYPLRHNGTNVHVGSAGETESTFRSYIFVTQDSGPQGKQRLHWIVSREGSTGGRGGEDCSVTDDPRLLRFRVVRRRPPATTVLIEGCDWVS
jgi:hypothetical protein